MTAGVMLYQPHPPRTMAPLTEWRLAEEELAHIAKAGTAKWRIGVVLCRWATPPP